MDCVTYWLYNVARPIILSVPMFSIIIPSWNNLPFLQLCIASIRKHSAYAHQIIVHVNEGSDGTLAWVEAQGLAHTVSTENCGVCYAVNQAAMLAKENYIVFMNDDMFCCPGWDSALLQAVNQLDTTCFFLSGTMIEPIGEETGTTIVRNFGQEVDTFDEQKLLDALPTLRKFDWHGASQPTLMHRDWWFKVGGFSIEFSPGMGSDNDLCMKMWFSGCRVFRVVGASLVYHFSHRSTLRIKKNNSRLQFMKKWGISTSMFNRYYLRNNTKATDWVLAEPKINASYRFNWMRVRLVMMANLIKTL